MATAQRCLTGVSGRSRTNLQGNGHQQRWRAHFGGDSRVHGRNRNTGSAAIRYTNSAAAMRRPLGASRRARLPVAKYRRLSGGQMQLLRRQPFRISPTFEFMIGAGPSISKAVNGENRDTSVSVEFALDFMFWPTKNLGWFVEPTWSINPRNGQ